MGDEATQQQESNVGSPAGAGHDGPVLVDFCPQEMTVRRSDERDVVEVAEGAQPLALDPDEDLSSGSKNFAKEKKRKKNHNSNSTTNILPQSFLQQKYDGNQDVQEEMLNNKKKDNGLPLCESEETSLDNKSEKSVSIVVVSEDYVCNQADLDIIEPIKKVPYKPGKEQVVLIDDAFIDRMNMECLFQPNAFLNDQVINAYITLLRAQDHLKLRACRKVLLENSLISIILKRHGDAKIKMEDLYPTHDNDRIKTIEQRVLSYLDHDMVFIQINIEHTHWYLAVVNAKEHEIQVLDSMGTIFGRQDLTLTIKGTQKQINIVSQRKDLKDHKWPNIQVSS